MNTKIKILIATIIFIICELIGIFLIIKYGNPYIKNGGYEAEVVSVHEGYVVAKCINNRVCEIDGDIVNIKIEVPDDIPFNVGDKIEFTNQPNYNNRHLDINTYVPSKDSSKKVANFCEFITGAPLGAFFLYLFLTFILKNAQQQNLFKYMPETSALLFVIGYLLITITEIDLINGIGFLSIIGAFALTFITSKKVYKLKN